jgi:AraC-like DNA-binding protein
LLLEEQLAEASTDPLRIEVVERFLISQLKASDPDPLVMAALALIHKSKGSLRIKDLALQLHTSASPLEKRFRQVVGASPKKFSSIVRLKHSIQQYPAAASLTDLGYEAGFYDQAHFIKEFRAVTGETPERFFK